MTHLRRTALLAVAVSFSALTACGNTADGVKKDAENAAEATKDASASAGAKTDSATSAMGAGADAAKQTADIKLALAGDSRVKATDINVDSDGASKTVTLRGRVATEAEKTIAGQIATEKAGGYKIVNEITVGTP